MWDEIPARPGAGGRIAHGGCGHSTVGLRLSVAMAYTLPCPALTCRRFRATGRLAYREFATPVPAANAMERLAAVARNTHALVGAGLTPSQWGRTKAPWFW